MSAVSASNERGSSITQFYDYAWIRLRLEMTKLADGPAKSYEFAPSLPGATSLYHCRTCTRSLSSFRAFQNHRIGRCEDAQPTTDKPRGARQSKGFADSRSPNGQHDILWFESRWRRAHSPEAKRGVLYCRDCRDIPTREGVKMAKPGGAVRCCVIGYLRSRLLTKPDPKNRRGTQEWRQQIARDTRPIHAIARSYGVRTEVIAECRAEFGTGRGRGRPRKIHP